MQSITDTNTIKACILGLAVGDALGVPVEFTDRTERDEDPVGDMRGHGSHDMPAGSWSDDTSMTLCALEALSAEEFSWDRVMYNFGSWFYKDEFTPTGYMFDVGGTCERAIEAFFVEEKDADHCGQASEQDNGNGSLMRILPFSLYAPDDLGFIEKASALTHAHRRSEMACGIYTLLLAAIIKGRSKAAVTEGLLRAKQYYSTESEWKHYESLFEIEKRERDSIISGGYVVTTLEAALWCLLTTDSYRECVLKAVNLGRDADTVAAVAGGLAGALYGLESIPQEWLDTLLKREYIEEMCEKASARWSRE